MLQTISQISANDRAHKTVMEVIKSHILPIENDSLTDINFEQ
jgi:hypothetical protein